MLNNKDITVTISTRNRYFTSLYSCLDSIANQTITPKKILVFDDGIEVVDLSKEEKYNNLFSELNNKNIEFEIVQGEKSGQVLNHQKALNIVDTEFIFRVDDDCVLDPNVLETLYDSFDKDTGAVGCLVLFKNQPIKKNPLASNKIEDVLFAQNIQWYIPETYEIREVDHLYSSFMFRKEAGLHGYDLELSPVGASEETQFTYGMVRNGWKCLFNPNATIWHHQDDMGGIRDVMTEENVIKDNHIFKKRLKEWGLNYNDPQHGFLCENYRYSIDFYDGVRVQIFGEGDKEFDVQIGSNIDEYYAIHKTKLKGGRFTKIPKPYYQNWEVFILDNDELLVRYKLNLKNQNVLVVLDTSAIGDTIAWVPYVDEFSKKHNCNVYCATFHNNLYKNEYPDIHFIDADKSKNSVEFLEEYMKNIGESVYAIYFIGWDIPWKSHPLTDDKGDVIKYVGLKNPNENKKNPLQQTSSDVLGLPFKEVRTKLTKPKLDPPINEKYITISEFSTGYAKQWNYPTKGSNMGWQELVNWLNELGYRVMVISKEPTELKNIIDHTGNYSLEQRMNEIQHADFHIGVSSGLSWLAWGLEKTVVMISGFTSPWFEFQENCIRISSTDEDICNGCWHVYDPIRGKFDWCPKQMDFECTKSITPELVIETLKRDLFKKFICVKHDCLNVFYVNKNECCNIKCPKCGGKGSSIDMRTGKKI